jgi:H+/Cl- antiporter ClcA/CBS domain-containing protein
MTDEPRHDHAIGRASTTEGLPVAPSMLAAVEAVASPRQTAPINRRVIAIAAIACAVAVVAALLAQALTALIGLITSVAFYGRIDTDLVSPAGHSLGVWVVLVPVTGAVVVGFMARFGSKAIRGHGIPEAMEQVLVNQSRIPARMVILKPLSAVISIGTGGPFGAEGPIIATGGALGSFVGQLIRITAEERKTLLAAGAAAGMAATFGSPVSAVLLAVELLLFEYRPRSVIPVALAAVTGTAVRIAFLGTAPAFQVIDIVQPPPTALAGYVLIGGLVGVASVVVTKVVYWVEDGFARLPIHWMWWPAIGAIPVGLIGIVSPHTMGVGYDNIEGMVSGTLAGRALVMLCAWKLVSWTLSLGSGTSGGTLAPLFTIGGGLGAALTAVVASALPSLGMDPRIGALVGMAAMFAGASRALLTSVVFAFEATRQPLGLLPLLGGCSAAYLVSCALMRHSIMTEKIARRGIRVPSEYAADHLAQVLVKDVALRVVVTLPASMTLAESRLFLTSTRPGSGHQGFPLVGDAGELVGLLTRRDLLAPAADPDAPLGRLVTRRPLTVSPDATLRDAADIMVRERVGRLPVVAAGRLVGIVSRSDLLDAHGTRLAGETDAVRSRTLPFLGPDDRA